MTKELRPDEQIGPGTYQGDRLRAELEYAKRAGGALPEAEKVILGRTRKVEQALGYVPPDTPAEKPDDVVERCAKAMHQSNLRECKLPIGTWDRMSLELREWYKNMTTAVLDAAGFERLREDLAREKRRGDLADSLREQNADSRDKAIKRAELAEYKLANKEAFLVSAYEREDGYRARIVELEKVVGEADALMQVLMRAHWPEPEQRLRYHRARKALDATSKDSGEPAGTPSPGLHHEGGYAEPAGSSSLSDDDARTVALMVQQVQLAYAAAKRRVEPVDAMLNPAEDEPALIRSALALLDRVRGAAK